MKKFFKKNIKKEKEVSVVEGLFRDISELLKKKDLMIKAHLDQEKKLI